MRPGTPTTVLLLGISRNTTDAAPIRTLSPIWIFPNTLAHNNLPDVEAEAIRALFERVKALEQQVEQLQGSGTQINGQDNGKINSDRAIQEFIDGAGI
jgi:serine O-acetyltransferase